MDIFLHPTAANAQCSRRDKLNEDETLRVWLWGIAHDTHRAGPTPVSKSSLRGFSMAMSNAIPGPGSQPRGISQVRAGSPKLKGSDETPSGED